MGGSRTLRLLFEILVLLTSVCDTCLNLCLMYVGIYFCIYIVSLDVKRGPTVNETVSSEQFFFLTCSACLVINIISLWSQRSLVVRPKNVIFSRTNEVNSIQLLICS